MRRHNLLSFDVLCRKLVSSFPVQTQLDVLCHWEFGREPLVCFSQNSFSISALCRKLRWGLVDLNNQTLATKWDLGGGVCGLGRDGKMAWLKSDDKAKNMESLLGDVGLSVSVLWHRTAGWYRQTTGWCTVCSLILLTVKMSSIFFLDHEWNASGELQGSQKPAIATDSRFQVPLAV